MAVTQDQVDQAQQAADQAQQRADSAQQAADASRDAAAQSRAAADNANTAAHAADSNADAMESAAGQRRADADAAAGACQRSRASAAQAQQAVDRAESNAQATHAQFPGACSPETDAADTAVSAAQAQQQAADSGAGTTCADAAQKETAARQAEADAATARSQANDADRTATQAVTAAEQAEQASRDAQAAAQRAVTDAATAKANYESLKAQFASEAATNTQPTTPGPIQPPPPAQPDHGNSAGHSGQPTPPTHGPGTTGSSLFDLNLTAALFSWKFSEGKWEKAPILLEVTEGYKHRYTVGTQYTFVAGARAEEVGGLDAKVTMVGDWRQINQTRYERNTGIKVESVLGDVDETTYAKEDRSTPVIRQDTNPTTYSSKGPEYQETMNKAVRDFKAKANDKYGDVRIKANAAIFHSNDAFISANVMNQRITTLKQEMEEHHAKFTDLQEQCKNYQIKSSSFVKLIASGGMKIKSGKLKGTIKSKVKAMAGSMAEFKGDVKLGG